MIGTVQHIHFFKHFLYTPVTFCRLYIKVTKIAAQAEKDKLEENDIRIPLDENSNDVTAFLAKQAVKATSKLKIRAIITDSYSAVSYTHLDVYKRQAMGSAPLIGWILPSRLSSPISK